MERPLPVADIALRVHRRCVPIHPQLLRRRVHRLLPKRGNADNGSNVAVIAGCSEAAAVVVVAVLVAVILVVVRKRYAGIEQELNDVDLESKNDL